MALNFEQMKEGLLPENQTYSVVEIDTYKAPGTPEAAGKLYETDSVSEIVPPQEDGIFYLIYDADGNAERLDEILGSERENGSIERQEQPVIVNLTESISDSSWVRKADWMPYQGPQGGEGWQSVETGEVVYDDRPPGDVDVDPDEYYDADQERLLQAVERVTGEELGSEWHQMSADEARAAIQELAEPDQFAEVMDELSSGIEISVLSDEQTDKILSEVTEKVDFDDTMALEGGRGQEILSEDASLQIENTIKDLVEEMDIEAGSGDVEIVYDYAETWKDSSYNDHAQTTEKMVKEATGIGGDYRNDSLDGRDPEEGEVQAMGICIEVAREFARRKYDQDSVARRGLQDHGAVDFLGNFLEDPNMESIEVEENTVANYSVSEGIPRSFSKYDIVFERDLNPDEVVGGPDLVQGHRNDLRSVEGEVWLPGGSQDASSEQVKFYAGEEPVSMAQIQEQGIDNLDYQSLAALSTPLNAILDLDMSLNEAQEDTVRRIGERAEEVEDINVLPKIVEDILNR